MSNLAIPEKIDKWGRAILVTAALVTGSFAVVSRAVSTIKAGPEAIAETASLKVRVSKLERQSCFIIRGMEKVAKIKYPRPDECEE